MCVYERVYVQMYGKRKKVLTTTERGPPRKRLENYEKCILCLWKGICANVWEKNGILIDAGSATKKGGKLWKAVFVFMKGHMCTRRKKEKVFD